MGRGKIPIKRIENASNRKVTFSKRNSGILKKAKEITVLCECQVSLIIFNSSDKLVVDWCSDNTTLENILDLYHKKNQDGTKLWDAKHENLSKEIERVKKENDSMQIELKRLKGEDIQSLQINELEYLEKVVEIGLTNIRTQKMECYKMFKRNIKILEDDNEQLQLNFIQQQREMQNGYDHHQTIRDYIPHAPFSYRVQPMQPNLQEAMY